MRQITCCAVLAGLLICLPLHGQEQPAKATHVTSPAHASQFADLTDLNLSLLLSAPPSADSPITHGELKELHRLEHERTPAQIAAAKADDQEQDIFIFHTVFGPSFTPENLPILAKFSAAIHAEEGLASGPLKSGFSRPRPYQADPTLQPICKLTTEPNSYPSGHTLSGYMFAFAMADIVPEKKAEIYARADDYAQNRLICGVHYPSDLEASRRLAAAMFGSMVGNPAFRKDLAAARNEFQAWLTLNTNK